MGELTIASALLQARGPLMSIEVHAPPVVLQLAQSQGQTPSPPPPPATGLALIDTGASATVVDENALLALGVNPIGTTTVLTPSGAEQQLAYPAEIEFAGMPGRIQFASVLGSKHLAAQGIIALIGRDVLANALLVFNGPAGMFTIAFN